MARVHSLVALGTLAVLSTSPAGWRSTESTLLARTGVIVAQRPMVVECRLVREELQDDPRFVSSMRDVVTLELLQHAGQDADQRSTARSLVWHMEPMQGHQPCLYTRTLHAALTQFSEGRVRFVLSWVGSTPYGNQFMRAEVYDLDLGSPQPAGLGVERACTRRSHEPIAVLQRTSRDRSPFTGEAEILMSSEAVQIRLTRDRGPSSTFEYRLRGQRWLEHLDQTVVVAAEEPIPDPIPIVIPAPTPAATTPAASAPTPEPVPPAVPAPGPRTPRR